MATRTYSFETETGGFHFRPSSGPTLHVELTDDQVERLRAFARDHDFNMSELMDADSGLYYEVEEAVNAALDAENDRREQSNAQLQEEYRERYESEEHDPDDEFDEDAYMDDPDYEPFVDLCDYYVILPEEILEE